MKELQKINIKKINFDLKKITWSNYFKIINPKSSIIFANEFFDCFPIKQFIKINGVEMIDYSIDKFLNNKNIDELIIISHKNWVEYIKKRHPNLKILPGGKTRHESSLIGLLNCNNKCKK